MANTEDKKCEPTRRPSRAPYFVGVALGSCYAAFLALSFYWTGGWINDLVQNHYVFFVGLPFAGLLAYFLVGTLENTKGRIEFEALGMRFRGASGPIIMWVIVFSTIVIGIRLVWYLGPTPR